MSAVVETRREAWGFPEAVVFVAGISTLGAEIAAARLVAPAFGASTVVWANTIAIVLVALAGGYRLCGAHPEPPPATPGPGPGPPPRGRALLVVPPGAAPPPGVTPGV